MSLEHIPLKDLNVLKRKLILERFEKEIEMEVLKVEQSFTEIYLRRLKITIRNINWKVDRINKELLKRKESGDKEYTENVVFNKIKMIDRVMGIIEGNKEEILRRALEMLTTKMLVLLLSELEE